MLTHHHLSKKEMAGGTFGRHGEHAGEGRARFVRLLSLEVADAQQIPPVEFGCGKARLDLLEQRDRLVPLASRIQRQTQQLCGLTILGSLLECRSKMGDRLLETALLEIALAEFRFYARRRRFPLP